MNNIPIDKAIEKAKLIRDDGWSSAIWQFTFIDTLLITLLNDLENKDKIIKKLEAENKSLRFVNNEMSYELILK